MFLKRGKRRPVEISTFDVFDTLIHRRVQSPADVFEWVRVKMFESELSLQHHDLVDGFVPLRMQAEHLAHMAIRNDGFPDGDATFDEIYSEFQRLTEADEAIVKALKSFELEIEKAVTFASPDGLKRYHAALDRGEQIAFISDMYLPSAWLAARLGQLGYRDAEKQPFYVSCEWRARKCGGGLFSKAAQDTNWPRGKHWVHLGDNREADIRGAKQAGLCAEHASWADTKSLALPATRAHAGRVIASIQGFLKRRHSSSFLPQEPAERLGYEVLGPTMFGFALWLGAMCKQHSLDRMIFIARDGWLPIQAFDLCKELTDLRSVDTEYFYMSRQTGLATGIREWDRRYIQKQVYDQRDSGIDKTLNTFGLDRATCRSELARRGIGDGHQRVAPEFHSQVGHTIEARFQSVLRNNAMCRQELEEYCRDLLSPSGKAGFVDIGFGGNIQKSFLSSISDFSARDRVIGLYMGLLPYGEINQRKGVQTNCWLKDGAGSADWEQVIENGGLWLIEALVSGLHGRTVELVRSPNGQITPVFDDTLPAGPDSAELVSKVQKGALRFIDDHLYLLKHLEPESICSSDWASEFARLVMEPIEAEAALLANLMHDSAPGGSNNFMPIAEKLGLVSRYSNQKRNAARVRSVWKPGFDRINGL